MNTSLLIPLRGGMGGMGFPWGGLLALLVLIALVAAVIYLLVKDRRRSAAATPAAQASVVVPPAPEDAAYRVLTERLARGDIEIDEFNARVAALRPVPPVTPADDPS